MKLNDMQPASGSKTDRKRVGRGHASGWGKTAGRGHKGQKARSGGFHKVGFEGGQMPLQRRVPKLGFHSRSAYLTVEITLGNLNRLDDEVITLETLKAAGLARHNARNAKVILSGEISKAITLQGLRTSKGARDAIIAAGGKVED